MSDTKGDDISRSFFVSQLRGLFDSSSLDPVLRSRVEEFLDSVNLFLDLLMNVRELPDGDEYQDDRVIATLRLMNYTRKIGRDEMYIKYVHQLVNMHLGSENYVEAALTLKLHADLHEWDMHAFVEALPELDLPRQSQFSRKEVLYLLIVEYLSEWAFSLFLRIVLSCLCRQRESMGDCCRDLSGACDPARRSVV